MPLSKIKDINLHNFGREEIILAEKEMPGLMSLRQKYSSQKPFKNMRISGSLHMTIQTAVLIETLKSLGAEIRWCSCNIFSTQDHAAAAIVYSKSAEVFAWKGETLTEYWQCTLEALTWDNDQGPDLIVDDGSDATGLIHMGVKYEKEYSKTGIMPDFGILDLKSNELHNMYNIILETLKSNPNKWTNMANKIIGVSEETTTGVLRLKQLHTDNELLFPAINVNDSVTKTKFDNLYGCRHSCTDAIMRATDVMISGKKAMVLGFGDVGKGSAASLKAAGAIVYVSEVDPICALQACMEGYIVTTIEDVVDIIDIFVTATGNKDVITLEHMLKMKNNAIVSNIGHFDNEIQFNALANFNEIKRYNIKPQVDKFTLPSGKSLIILAEGRLMNLGCATGHPSFVMSCSFTNQVLAQLELVNNKNLTKKIYNLDKKLDEEVARLHLSNLNAKLTILNKEQADYIGVTIDGPFKSESYKY
jgi:adenosylhomocysteinase